MFAQSIVEDDADLVRRSQEGDTNAFSELVKRYHQQIFHTVFGLVGDRDDADDVAQEAFLKAYQAISRFNGESRFYTWMYRVAVNCCLDWLKSRKRKRGISLEREWWEQQDDVIGLVGSPASSDVLVTNRELSETLKAALEVLSPDFRATVVLRYMEGRSHNEIASLLGCSCGTVKSRLFRARMQLREVLDSTYCDWYGERLAQAV